NILLSIHAICNRAGLDWATQRRFPKDLAGVGIEGAELLIEIAPEDEIAGGRERRTVAGNGAFVKSDDFSGRRIHLRNAAVFLRIRSGTTDALALFRLSALAVLAGGGTRHV